MSKTIEIKEEDLKQVHTKISISTHKKLKIIAIMGEKKMEDIIAIAINEYLEKQTEVTGYNSEAMRAL